MTIHLRREDTFNGKLEKLRELLDRFRDEEGLQIILHVQGREFSALLHPPPDYRVKPSSELVEIITSRLRMKVSL